MCTLNNGKYLIPKGPQEFQVVLCKQQVQSNLRHPYLRTVLVLRIPLPKEKYGNNFTSLKRLENQTMQLHFITAWFRLVQFLSGTFNLWEDKSTIVR